MSYVKNTWNTGDTITAAKLNNMENGIYAANQGSSATLIPKTITQNGTYNAQNDGADGYSSVTANISGGGDLPSYTSEDVNKSLTVEAQVVSYTSGEPVFEYVPGWKSVIPQAIDEDVNKVLTVESTYNSETYQTDYIPVWKEGVPSIDYAGDGDILVVSESSGEKRAEWRQIIPSPEYYDGYYLMSDGDYLVWDSSLSNLNLEGYNFPSYYNLSEGDVLVVSDTSGTASLSSMSSKELIQKGLGDWVVDDAITPGYALVVNPSSGDSDHVIWQEIIPDPSSLPEDTILAKTSDGWGPSWSLPTAGSGVESGALLCVESTSDLTCSWDDILSIINHEAGTPNDGDVLTYRNGSLAWEAPQISN